jgi:copper chaperone CopZ
MDSENEDGADAVRTIELAVSGMACRRCVREVTARLRDVAGVETVTANAATSVVRLVGTMSLDQVFSAFDGTAYTVRRTNEPGSQL